MTLVVHWLGGSRVLYTSEQNPWTMLARVSPPYRSASAVIAQSSPATFLAWVGYSSQVQLELAGLEQPVMVVHMVVEHCHCLAGS